MSDEQTHDSAENTQTEEQLESSGDSPKTTINNWLETVSTSKAKAARESKTIPPRTVDLIVNEAPEEVKVALITLETDDSAPEEENQSSPLDIDEESSTALWNTLLSDSILTRGLADDLILHFRAAIEHQHLPETVQIHRKILLKEVNKFDSAIYYSLKTFYNRIQAQHYNKRNMIRYIDTLVDASGVKNAGIRTAEVLAILTERTKPISPHIANEVISQTINTKVVSCDPPPQIDPREDNVSDQPKNNLAELAEEIRPLLASAEQGLVNPITSLTTRNKHRIHERDGVVLAHPTGLAAKKVAFVDETPAKRPRPTLTTDGEAGPSRPMAGDKRTHEQIQQTPTRSQDSREQSTSGSVVVGGGSAAHNVKPPREKIFYELCFYCLGATNSTGCVDAVCGKTHDEIGVQYQVFLSNAVNCTRAGTAGHPVVAKILPYMYCEIAGCDVHFNDCVDKCGARRLKAAAPGASEQKTIEWTLCAEPLWPLVGCPTHGIPPPKMCTGTNPMTHKPCAHTASACRMHKQTDKKPAEQAPVRNRLQAIANAPVSNPPPPSSKASGFMGPLELLTSINNERVQQQQIQSSSFNRAQMTSLVSSSLSSGAGVKRKDTLEFDSESEDEGIISTNIPTKVEASQYKRMLFQVCVLDRDPEFKAHPGYQHLLEARALFVDKMTSQTLMKGKVDKHSVLYNVKWSAIEAHWATMEGGTLRERICDLFRWYKKTFGKIQVTKEGKRAGPLDHTWNFLHDLVDKANNLRVC